MVYKVLNMDIIITKTLLTPRSRVDYFYDGWMDALYWTSKSQQPFTHCHYKAWKSQDIFLYNSDCINLKEESRIHLKWLEGEQIMG